MFLCVCHIKSVTGLVVVNPEGVGASVSPKMALTGIGGDFRPVGETKALKMKERFKFVDNSSFMESLML